MEPGHHARIVINSTLILRNVFAERHAQPSRTRGIRSIARPDARLSRVQRTVNLVPQAAL